MTDLENECSIRRKHIQSIGTAVRAMLDSPDFNGKEAFPGQHAEMKANIMLAYRHLEDARMRLGKCMQQIQGGVSIYDPMEKQRREDAVS